MLGLILKDFLTLKKYCFTLLALMGFYVILGAMKIMDLSFISSFIIVLLAIASITTFSYDQFSKWDLYAMTFPVRRRDIVGARYASTLLFILGGLVISFLVNFIFAFIDGVPVSVETFAVNGSVAVISVILISVLLPIVYQLGVERARIALFAIFILPYLAIFILKGLQVPMPTEQQVITALCIAPFAALVMLVASYFLSCRIYEKKEF